MSLSRFRLPATLFASFILVLLLELPAWAEPALWKVSGPHATVYLYGGIHLLRDTSWRTPRFEAAFDATASLWEEIANADDPAAARPLFMKYGMDAEHPLSSKLDAAGKQKLLATTTVLGIAEHQMEPLQPWLAALQVTIAPLVKAGYDPNSGTDVALKKLAVQQGKIVRGFETQEQQMQYFAGLPQTLQTQYLLSTLDSAQAGPTRLAALVDAWNAGDTAKMEALLNQKLARSYPQLYNVLVVQRNKLFASEIETLLKADGNAFVAVGVAHLLGNDSVIADLAHDGYTAVRQ